MTIVIKIIDGDKVIDYESLSDQQKKEYGQKLNDQALTTLGYVRKGWIYPILNKKAHKRKRTVTSTALNQSIINNIIILSH